MRWWDPYAEKWRNQDYWMPRYEDNQPPWWVFEDTIDLALTVLCYLFLIGCAIAIFEAGGG